MLVRKGLISEAELNQALALQYGRNIKLGELLVDNHLISQTQLEQVIREQSIMLGELLLEERLISQKQLDQALALQHDSAKKLGQILVEKYLISAKKLEEILEKQYWQQNGFWLI